MRVLYFGVLKDAFGRSGEDVELADEASVADLMAACRGRAVGAAGVWDSMAVAVNQEYARGVDVLKDGDEVALLPPVSGGVLELDDWDRKAYPRGDPKLKHWATSRDLVGVDRGPRLKPWLT